MATIFDEEEDDDIGAAVASMGDIAMGVPPPGVNTPEIETPREVARKRREEQAKQQPQGTTVPDPMAGIASATQAPRPGGRMQEVGRTTTTVRDRGKLSEASQENLEAQRDLTEQAKQTTRDQAELKQRRAGVEEEFATKLAEFSEASAKATEQLNEQTQETIQAAKKNHEESLEEFRNFKFRDYWSSKSTSEEVLAKVGMALSGIGAGVLTGLTGRPVQNRAIARVQEAVARDFEKQRQQLAKLKDEVAMARAGVQDERLAKQDLLADNFRKEAGALRSIQARMKQRMAALGADEAQIEADARIQALEKQALQREQQALSITNERVRTTVAKQRQRVAQNLAQTGANAGLLFDAKGKPIAAMDKKQALEVNQKLSVMRNLRRRVLQLRKNFDEYDIELFSGSEASQDRARLLSEIKALKNQADELGAMDEGTLGLLDDAVKPGTQALAFGNATTKLDGFVEAMDADARSLLASKGLPPQQFMEPMLLGDPDAQAAQQQKGTPVTVTLKDGTKVPGRQLPDGRIVHDVPGN